MKRATTITNNSGASALAKVLHPLSERHSGHDVFRWLLDTTLIGFGLTNRENRTPDSAKKRIDDAVKVYLQTVYDGEYGQDILGDLYMEIRSRWGKSALGQYFTPQIVCDMMAIMTLSEMPCSPDKDQRFIRVMEPTCGAGTMLLSTLRALSNAGPADVLLSYSFTAIDLDSLCASMTAVQLLANAAVHDRPLGELIVFQGDSLRPPSDWTLVVHATAAVLTEKDGLFAA